MRLVRATGWALVGALVFGVLIGMGSGVVLALAGPSARQGLSPVAATLVALGGAVGGFVYGWVRGAGVRRR